LMRWQGHRGSAQPRTEWWHMGAYGYYRWRSSGPHLALRLDQYSPIQNNSVQLDVGTRYNFKMRVETIPGQPGGLYSLKVWEHGQAQPSGWDLYAQDGSSDLQNGSLLLLAHRVDASFGDVTITPGPFDDTTPPIISDIQVAPGETSVTITWTTNEPATSSVAYGPSAAYENGSVDDSALVTEHTITLTSLIPGSIYHYQVTSVDGSGNAASSSDLNFRTSGVSPGIVSDDFNACSLDAQIWEFIDPLGDATLTMVGTYTDDAWVSISVPAGVQHTMSSSNQDAPRIMQPVNDTDFEIEVKFESALNATYQLQGVLIEEEENQHFLRFDFFSDSPHTKIFAGVYDDGSFSSRIHQVVAGTDVAPLYMRVRREGDQWTQSYSFDGDDWTTSGSFEHALTVSKVGAFVGNSDDTDPPAHTAFIDYFFNTVSPIIPEDGERNTITIHTVGSGTVDVVPDPPYACGDVVTLTARATEPGWSFSSWSGDLLGSVNPITATMTGSRVVTATFTRQVFLPFVTNQYSP
jgi:hypothetical protein